MKTLFKNEPVREIQIEKITFSGIRSFDASDRGSELAARAQSKTFRWGTQQVGDCTLEAPMLWITQDGFFMFSGNLRSSGNDDSWGILHFDFLQDNGLVLWSSGSFWSPTIGTFGTWRFQFTYPEYLFDTIKSAQFASHC